MPFTPQTPIHLGQQGFYPHFPMNNRPLQTPIQPFFSPQPPPTPGRLVHHHGHASIANLAAAGIHPPNGFPITPLNGHFPRPSMMGIPGHHPMGHPFPNRNRRQLSIGGPPKAVLGGPARKLSPLPVAAQNTPAPPPQKVKKVNVNLPKESIPGVDGLPPTRPPWARTVLDSFEFSDQEIIPVEFTTAESYPSDQERHHIPNTLEVFLPGQRAWDEMKQKDIEEKLEKLGVEKGSGSNVPHIYAPHARAASISSPADPQILAYKLNKLQQSQDPTLSANNSLSSSPHPPFGLLSSSPHRPSPRFMTNRHGHTMSLALPQQPFFDPVTNAFDPFSLDGVVGPIPHSGPSTQEGIYAPQACIPPDMSSLAPLQGPLRSASRPDFTRGFGLDIPEEDEEEEQVIETKADGEPAMLTHTAFIQHERVGSHDRAVDDINVEYDRTGPHHQDGIHTASQSRIHSRHVSRLSAALSTRSAGALEDEDFVGDEDVVSAVHVGHVNGIGQQEDLDAAGEWTGSEDVCEASDAEESIGEWSNPSDEERARQGRLERRARRRASQMDRPRRIPNFPRPPENTVAVSLHDEEDIISNPSDEGREYLGGNHYSRTPSNLDGSSRPFPHVLHSRDASGRHTTYDLASSHSRQASSQFVYPNNQAPALNQPALNPFAKPFVFGAPREPLSQNLSSDVTPPKVLTTTGHKRVLSIGKPLNVAAPEFKPGAFNFRPPPGVPTMPPAPSLDIRPLPEIEPSPFKVQGREKRPRLGSSTSLDEGDSMMSFKFPVNLDSPVSIRHATSGSKGHKLNPSAEPFTFSGFSVAPKLPHVSTDKENIPPSQLPPGTNGKAEQETLENESVERAGDGGTQGDEIILPTAARLKRAPIPLDFKHPVSTNTVPAGLFKALINNGDERTRRTVRSRMSSREIFEHGRLPSMDDVNVHNISRSRSRLVTDPGLRQASPADDVFGSDTTHFRRRSSFTDIVRPIRPLSGSDDGSNSDHSAMSLTGRLEVQQSERRIETMFEERLAAALQDLLKDSGDKHSATQTMISEVQSLFRTQLQEAAIRSLEDSQMDARGELDVQLFKDIVESGNKELIGSIGGELQALQQQMWQARSNTENSADLVPIVEQVGNSTISAIIEAISEASARQEAIAHVSPARERDAIVDKLMTMLTPVVASVRQEPIDYEFLTSQLTQAVKPHISQLIDLASDKRETAALIVDRIIPLLPESNIDVDAITCKLIAEIRRAIAPIDAFEIKEQVADLVVERLDSRLAVRDKGFNADNISSRVTDSVAHSLEPLQAISTCVDQLTRLQDSVSSSQDQVVSGQDRILDLVSALPYTFTDELQNLRSTQHDILSKLEQPTDAVQGLEPDKNILLVKTTVEDIASGQAILGARSEELCLFQKTILEKLDALPDILQDVTHTAQTSHADLLSSLEGARREADELRRSNTEHQIQLTKARGAHGQIRVEKDLLDEKVHLLSGERDRLRNQVQELQVSSTTNATQVTTLEARNQELEEALAKALTRLQASDVASQTNQERIDALEKANREITAERQSLKSKVESLDLQVTFAMRDKQSAVQALTTLQQQYDHLASQQSHWDDLHRASEKIEMLSNLIGQADNEELKELRRHRDRTRALEGEHTALQKRFREQESKISNSERAALTARQSLAQAQQRSSEWERRAKEYEGQLELTQTKLEQAEQMHAQLEADHSLIKMQLEEREANDRLTKDQQDKLHEQIAALEAKVTRLQSEIVQVRATKAAPVPYRNITNGNTNGITYGPAPPDSRASTIYDAHASQKRQSSVSSTRTDTPSQQSVWDSIHAPSSQPGKQPLTSIHAPRGRYPYLGPTTPKARRPQQQQYYRQAIPSPTPSTVSAAPTQGEDGWWS